jgi:hypothetical protein
MGRLSRATTGWSVSSDQRLLKQEVERCCAIPMTAYDFSKPETQALFEAEVKKRVELFGMTRQQAEMVVAALMTDPPPKPELRK